MNFKTGVLKSLLHKNKKEDNKVSKKIEKIPPRGCMSNISDEEIKELARLQRAKLPVLVTNLEGEQMIQFSALLPDGKEKIRLKSASNPQKIRHAKAVVEKFEKDVMKQVKSESISRTLISNADKLNVGYLASLSDSEDNFSDNSNISLSDEEDDCMNIVKDSIKTNGNKNLLPFETTAWETGIVWGDGDNQNDDEMTDAPIGSPPAINQIDNDNNNKNDTAVDNSNKEKNDNDNDNSNEKQSNTNNIDKKLEEKKEVSDDSDSDEDMGIVFDSDDKQGEGSKKNTLSNDSIISKQEKYKNEKQKLMISSMNKSWSSHFIHNRQQNNEDNDNNDNKNFNEILKINLDTPFDPELDSCKWLDQVMWEGELLNSDTPIVPDYKDISCITRKEVEMAYGNDIRPGAVRITEALEIQRKREIVDPETMGKKQYKKLTKAGRQMKLREAGYFRFINVIVAQNLKDGKGIRDRLRCKRLPDIPKEVLVNFILTLNKTEPRESDIHRLHHPVLTMQGSSKLIIKNSKFLLEGLQNSVGQRATSGIRQINRNKWNKNDLSALSGPVCLMEYLEERPPLLCNVGMSSLLIDFFMSEKIHEPGNLSMQNPQGRRQGKSRGRRVILEPTDRSPFFAILNKKEECLSLCNDLWVAPVAEHEVSQTDFLLIHRKEIGSKKFLPECSLRNIKSLHLVGQTEPQRDVFHPNNLIQRSSKKTEMAGFLEKFLEYHITRVTLKFNKIKSQSDCEAMFPRVSPGFIKRVYLNMFPKNKQQTVQLTPKRLEQLRDELPIYSICQYDSMLVGVQRLKDLGIIQVTKEEVKHVMHALAVLIDIYQIAARSQFSLNEAKKSGGTVGVMDGSEYELELGKKAVVLPEDAQIKLKTAQFIVDELQLTPWYLTKSYTTMRMSEQPRLKLTGLGDPSGRLEAVSYLPENIEGLGNMTKASRRRRQGREIKGSAAIMAARSALAAEKKEETANEKKKKKHKQVMEELIVIYVKLL